MRRPSARKVWSALLFLLTVAIETVGRRRLSRVLARRLGGAPIEAGGLESVPAAGPFVIAVNHHGAGTTAQIVAAALFAIARARPGLADDCVIVVGRRVGKPSLARKLASALFQRWDRSVIRVPTHNAAPSLSALRALRERAAEKPLLVLPEGRASITFEDVRAGAGRFLASLPAPTLPVAVWPEEGGFRVEIGRALSWSRRTDLHDLQLGLAIAAMLPATLAPAWQGTLARWREAHAAPRDDEATAREAADRAGS